MDPMAGEMDRQYQPKLLSCWPRETVLPSLFLRNQDAHRRTCCHTLTHPGGVGGLCLQCQVLYFPGVLSRVGNALSDHHDGCFSEGRSTGELKQHVCGS